RVRRPTLFSLWRKARRENSAASRLLGSTSLRFALHGWQRSTTLPRFFLTREIIQGIIATQAGQEMETLPQYLARGFPQA
ncbi:hypothetical protein, partial [Thiolapillus sp.]|uniref:hypothetical protein n=1 Tax=Thiolapillus sp. TaxID=2017437 RepID=UPI003AF6AA8D